MLAPGWCKEDNPQADGSLPLRQAQSRTASAVASLDAPNACDRTSPGLDGFMDQAAIDSLTEARAKAYDSARAEAVAKIHERGRLTARERITAVLDPGSFIETGVLAGDEGEPAAGFVGGYGTLYGRPIAIGSYDYSVAGGTQTSINHTKLARVVELAQRYRWPLLCFADGGGARAQGLASGRTPGGAMRTGMGDYDGLAALSGWAPIVSIVSGRSFAGTASIAGFSDVVFATRGSAIGMGGPPLVEAALGLKLSPEELAPSEMHEVKGGIDRLVQDEPEAIDLARKYLAFFLVDKTEGTISPTHDSIRSIVPDNRRGLYDMRKVVTALTDLDSVLELRPNWATSAITAFARIGGHSIAVIANQPLSPIAGAIDADASDKFARFIGLADAFDIPILSLLDSPGFMLGPDAERAGIARHHARPLLAQMHRTVPLFLIHIRKAYGFGPSAMGYQYQANDLRLAWPNVEAGGMALEGAATLIRRKEGTLHDDEQAEREARNAMATELRARSLALNAGRNYAYDEVIDPAETRDRVIRMLELIPRPPPRERKKRYIDPW